MRDLVNFHYRNFRSRCPFCSVKFCLFIDGLDEHDSNHLSLVAFIQSIAALSNVKVIVSSRPLLEFEDAFEIQPSLRFQDLTYNDIKICIDTRLRENRRFVATFRRDPEGTLCLVREILQAADGVFLWVRLIIDSLLEGVMKRDRISDLQRRLRALPADIEGMFANMLHQVDPTYLQQSSKLFQLVQSGLEFKFIDGAVLTPMLRSPNSGGIYRFLLSFAVEDDDVDLHSPPKPYAEQEISYRCIEIRDRLKTRCAGLLEIIIYLARTKEIR